MTLCVKIIVLFATFRLAYCSLITREIDSEVSSNSNDDTPTRPCAATTQQHEIICDETANRASPQEYIPVPQSAPRVIVSDPVYIDQETLPYNDGSTFMYIPQPYAQDWRKFSYQSNSPSGLESIGIAMSNYGGIIYPHAHPKLLAGLNPSFPVNSLPPVHSTFIHGTFPRDDAVQPNYDIDVLSPQNVMIVPSNARPGRAFRSRQDDFLAELSHDAIMNNILPTMPVPFARYASPASLPSAPAIAVFPNAPLNGCSLPILVSCTPKISHGLVAAPYPGNVPVPSSVHQEYKQADAVMKSTNEKQDAHLKAGQPSHVKLVPKEEAPVH